MDPEGSKKVLFIDFEKCTGCRTCEVACSLRNEGICNPALSRITIVKWEEMGIDVPMVCQQCENPPCRSVCPKFCQSPNDTAGSISPLRPHLRYCIRSYRPDAGR